MARTHGWTSGLTRRGAVAGMALTLALAATMLAVVPGAQADAATSGQSYDLTTSTYCSAGTGLVSPTINANLISNSLPTTATVTPRTAFFPGATKATSSYTDASGNAVTSADYVDGSGNLVLKGGTAVADPGAVTLPDCWLDTSSLSPTDPAEEIATAQAPSSYPGRIGALANASNDFYGGKSANDAAATGTTTTVSQVIDLTTLGDVTGHIFQFAAALGGFADQSDNAVIQAIWQDDTGMAVLTSTLGPDLPDNRDGISMSDAYSTTGAVPAGAVKVKILVTLTHGGAGHNDASATAPYLAISDSDAANHTTFQAGESDYTGSCSAAGDVATSELGENLIANPGAENLTTIAPTVAATTAPGSGSAKVTGSFAIPDCWTVPSGYFAHGVVPIAATDRTAIAYAKGATLPDGSTNAAAIAAAANVTAATASASGYNRVADPNSTNGVANASNYHVFYGGKSMVNGSTGTFTQSVDLTHLTTDGSTATDATGQYYELKAWLGGYQTQVDNASVTVTFEDADGGFLSSNQAGAISEPNRVAYGTPNGTDNSMLLPTSTTGTVPAGATTALVTISAAAYASGNDDGMADDVSLILGGSAAGDATSQTYDATSSTYCSAATGLATAAQDANLISNAGAENYVSAVKLGANGDSSVTVPACWVSASALAQPKAVAESSAQTLASYPQPGFTGTSARVFEGGANPVDGIAGVSTTSTQTIGLGALGAIDGSDFKLAGWLGGYATQDDNAVVTASFENAKGDILDIGSIGPVKAAARGSISQLLQQAWYGTIPTGTTQVVVTVTMTAVASGAANNGEADNLSLVIGDSAAPVGPILQTLPYDAKSGGQVSIDPTTGLPLPPAGGLYRPAGVSALSGTAYVSNTGDNVLAALAKGSNTTIAGSLTGYGENGDEGKAVDATLYQPAGSAIDEAGDVYIADSGDNVIREITPDGIIHRVAGTGEAGGAHAVIAADSHATDINLDHPESVALDDAGNLYVADTYENRVLEVTPSGAISIFAGTGASGYTGDGAAASTATLAMPTAVALDAEGDVYIADAANNVIRRVDKTTGDITTVAGDYAADQAANDCLGGYSGDGGPATAAQLNDPQSIALDGAGDLFIADTFNNVIREVTPDGTISTVVNGGSNGTAGGESSGQAPTASMLNTPYATAFDSKTGVLYIADTRNSAIAEVTGIAHTATAGVSGVGAVEPGDQIAVTGSGRAAQLCAPSVTYSIGYDLAAADATDAGNPSSYTNKTPDFSLVNPTRPGYTFAGWTGSGITGASTDVTIQQWTNGDLHFTATWTIDTHTVAFDLEGKGVPIASQTIDYGARATRPADPSAAGSTFAGWYADASLTAAFDFATPITTDTTLYAKWATVTPVCTFVSDNATLTSAKAALGADEKVLAKNTSALAADKKLLSKDKATLKKAKSTAARAQAQKKVTAISKKITAVTRTITSEKKTVAAAKRAVATAEAAVTADAGVAECQSAVRQAALTTAKATLSADEKVLAKNTSVLTADKKLLSKDKAAVKKAKSKAAKASAQKKVAAVTKKITAVTTAIASEKKTVTAAKKAVAAAQAAVDSIN